jgi:hypothetical protein
VRRGYGKKRKKEREGEKGRDKGRVKPEGPKQVRVQAFIYNKVLRLCRHYFVLEHILAISKKKKEKKRKEDNKEKGTDKLSQCTVENKREREEIIQEKKRKRKRELKMFLKTNHRTCHIWGQVGYVSPLGT